MKTNWLQKIKDKTLTAEDFDYHWIISNLEDGTFSPVYFTSFLSDVITLPDQVKLEMFSQDNISYIQSITLPEISAKQDLSGKSFRTREEAVKFLRDNDQPYYEQR